MSKKSMIIAGCSIVGVLVLLILFVWLLSAFKKSYTTYEKVEEKMVEAAKNYYKTYPELLPVEEGKYTLQYSALVEGKFIKPLNELLKDGDHCTAEVNVYKNGESYDYIPKLNCGQSYSTLELVERILSDNPVTDTGSGLYLADDGSYYFRGKITNNYLTLGKTGSGNTEKKILWRILGIDENGNIHVRSETAFSSRTVYDNRYNVDVHKTYGYNDYEGSILKDFLVKMNNSTSFLTKNEKSKLVPQQICIGRRSSKDNVNDGSIECAEKSEPLLFGTITPYEYVRASLDENCVRPVNRSCGNFNYLYNSNNVASEWTVTSTTENTNQAWALNGAVFELLRANTSRKIFPTAYISARTLYKSGTGKKSDPYVIVVTKKKSSIEK